MHNAICQNVREKGWAAPVDVLIGISVLSKGNYENWRFGRIPFLEKVCQANLRQLSEIMREVRAYADKKGLKPS